MRREAYNPALRLIRGETSWVAVSPASSRRKHSRTSSQSNVTEIPPKEAG